MTISRRTLLSAVPIALAGCSTADASTPTTMESTQDAQTAAVSFEIAPEELANPPAVTVSVDEWGDADSVRVICPATVPLIQFIKPGGADFMTLEMELGAGFLVESVHGDWRTTIAKRWLVKEDDEPAVSSEEPSLEEEATWIAEENRTVPTEGGSE